MIALKDLRRHASILAALAVGLAGAAWTLKATYRASLTPLGRDPGIFQYVAWAISRGQRDYAQIHEMNGPLVHLIHLLFLALGGRNEQVFRSLDFAFLGLAAFATGALLPGIGVRGEEVLERIPWTTRAAWGVAAWVVLTGGIMLFGWWEHGQRETFYDDFLCVSIALQLAAQRPSGLAKRRWMLFAAGALSALPWFGKPSCLVYTVGQLLALGFDDGLGEKAAPLLKAFLLGCAATCGVMGVFLVVWGNPVAFARILLVEVPRMHMPIWQKSFVEAYEVNDAKLNVAGITMAIGIVGIGTKRLPWRFLAILALVIGGLFTYFLQSKGYPYHLLPIVAGTHLFWLACAIYASERVARPEARVPAWMLTGTALGVIVLAGTAIYETRESSSLHNDWYEDRVAGGPNAEPFLKHFDYRDYHPTDLRMAARYLRRVTDPEDRVQGYGMDPYLLFLARRLSATPFIYNFELNVDAALHTDPSEEDRRWLVDTAKRNEEDLLAALERSPPAAFVLIDRAPFTRPADAELDFAAHCPEASAWMHKRYRDVRHFGYVRVWLRNDLDAEPRRSATE